MSSPFNLRFALLGLLAACQAAPAALATTPQEQFEALRLRYKAEQEKVQAEAEAENGKPREERLRTYRERDPANTMIDEFLKLEEQHRGTLVGLSALHQLISAASSYAFLSEYPVTAGGQQAMRVLAAHYADHPDLDIFMALMQNANEAKPVFRRAMESPHRHVRGAATFALAQHFQTDAIVPPMQEAVLDLLADAREEFKEDIARYTKARQHWGRVDTEICRREALHLLDQVMLEYGDVPAAPRTGYGPVLLTVDRSLVDPLTKKTRRPLAELAEPVRRELTELAIGQPLPEIAGPDAFGNELNSDQLGKVTVLMFSFKGCGPCEAMYADNRKLIEAYHGRPFAFLGVMNDDAIDTVKASVEDGTITWPVWWDSGKPGPLSTRFNVRGWPEIYVLDHQGIIRYREIHGEILAKAVAKLVEAAEQMP